MMPTRVQIFSTSESTWLERKTVAPAFDPLADDLEDGLLVQRVETARRLVEKEQFGVVHERKHERELLLVALGELLHALRGVELQALDEVGRRRRLRAAEAGEVVDVPLPGLAVVEVHLARDVADAPTDGRAVKRDGLAEHLASPAVGRSMPRRQRIVVVLPAPFGPRNP